jgi:hypothetical protein
LVDLLASIYVLNMSNFFFVPNFILLQQTRPELA